MLSIKFYLMIFLLLFLPGGAVLTAERDGFEPEFEVDFAALGRKTASFKPKRVPANPQAPLPDKVLVELDGTGSEDPDGDTLTYRWTQVDGPEVVLSRGNSPKPFFRTSVPGRYRFSLIVFDGQVKSDPAMVEVDVQRPNVRPQAILSPSLTVVVGTDFTLDGSGSRDGDGDALKFRFTQTAGPPLFLTEEACVGEKLTHRVDKAGVYEFQLVVNDGKAWSLPVRCRVMARRPNQRPVAKVGRIQKLSLPRPGEQQSGAAPNGAPVAVMAKGQIVTSIGNPVLLDGSASYSGRKRALLYFWQQRGGPFIGQFKKPDGNEAKRSFTPELVGTYVFQLVVNDGEFDSNPQRVEVKVVEGDMPPVAVIRGSETALVGRKIILDGSKSFDRESARLTYAWRQIGGPKITNVGTIGDNVSGGNKAVYVPPTTGIYTFGLRVSDGIKKSKEVKWVVSVKQGNAPPVVRAVEALKAKPGEFFLLSARGSDPEAAPLSYRWQQISGPVLLERPAAQPQVQLKAKERGIYRFSVTVSDGSSTSEPALCTVTVGAGKPSILQGRVQ